MDKWESTGGKLITWTKGTKDKEFTSLLKHPSTYFGTVRYQWNEPEGRFKEVRQDG